MNFDPTRFTGILGDDGLHHLAEKGMTSDNPRALCGAPVISTTFLETQFCPSCRSIADGQGPKTSEA